MRGGGSQKAHIEEGLPKMGGGLGQFPNLMEGLARKRGVVLLREGCTPTHTMEILSFI